VRGEDDDVNPRSRIRYSDADGDEYYEVANIFEVENSAEWCIVVQNYSILCERHEQLRCAQVKRMNTLSLIKLSDLKLPQIHFVHLIPDFSQPASAQVFFHNRFLDEQWRAKTIVPVK
jgi:hypothetical protein